MRSSFKYSDNTFSFKSGLISLKRSANTSAFGRPSVECKAGNWRLILLGCTVSASTIVICPTPARQIISAAYAPTPPKPTTSTWEFRKRSILSSPSNNSVRCCHSVSVPFITFLKPFIKPLTNIIIHPGLRLSARIGERHNLLRIAQLIGIYD